MEFSGWILNLIVTHEEEEVVSVVEIYRLTTVDTWLMGSNNYRKCIIIKQKDHKRSKS